MKELLDWYFFLFLLHQLLPKHMKIHFSSLKCKKNMFFWRKWLGIANDLLVNAVYDKEQGVRVQVFGYQLNEICYLRFFILLFQISSNFC